MRLAAAFASLVLTLGLVACEGGGAKEPLGKRRDRTARPDERTRVTLVVEALEEAARRDEAGVICGQLLSRRIVRRLSAAGIDCTQQLQRSLRRLGDASVSVESVTVKGARATARVSSSPGGRRRIDTLGFVLEDGQWRAASLGG